MASIHEYQEKISLLRIEDDKTWPHNMCELGNSALTVNEPPSPELATSLNTPSLVIRTDTSSPPSAHFNNSPGTQLFLFHTQTPTSKRRQRLMTPAENPTHTATKQKRLPKITSVRPGLMVAPMDDAISQYCTPTLHPRHKSQPILFTATSTPQYVTVIIHYDSHSPSTPPPPVLTPQRETVTPLTTPHIAQKHLHWRNKHLAMTQYPSAELSDRNAITNGLVKSRSPASEDSNQ